jgi:hypothetical protein
MLLSKRAMGGTRKHLMQTRLAEIFHKPMVGRPIA